MQRYRRINVNPPASCFSCCRQRGAGCSIPVLHLILSVLGTLDLAWCVEVNKLPIVLDMPWLWAGAGTVVWSYKRRRSNHANLVVSGATSLKIVWPWPPPRGWSKMLWRKMS